MPAYVIYFIFSYQQTWSHHNIYIICCNFIKIHEGQAGGTGDWGEFISFWASLLATSSKVTLGSHWGDCGVTLFSFWGNFGVRSLACNKKKRAGPPRNETKQITNSRKVRTSPLATLSNSTDIQAAAGRFLCPTVVWAGGRFFPRPGV